MTENSNTPAVNEKPAETVTTVPAPFSPVSVTLFGAVEGGDYLVTFIAVTSEGYLRNRSGRHARAVENISKMEIYTLDGKFSYAVTNTPEGWKVSDLKNPGNKVDPISHSEYKVGKNKDRVSADTEVHKVVRSLTKVIYPKASVSDSGETSSRGLTEEQKTAKAKVLAEIKEQEKAEKVRLAALKAERLAALGITVRTPSKKTSKGTPAPAAVAVAITPPQTSNSADAAREAKKDARKASRGK